MVLMKQMTQNNRLVCKLYILSYAIHKTALGPINIFINTNPDSSNP
jgi:hypothetical protein